MSETAAKQPEKKQSTDYVVVARRYRPQQFDELIGQEHVAVALTNAIETNRTGHAYLFTGARGVGKTSAARILAKALNCVEGPTGKPCGKCEICRDVSSGHDMDVLEIDGASNRGIDEIRQLRQNVNIRPSRARSKIYIIDEVHMLTREAFNALLKTLEEPPEHVKFIFCTTEPNKIPITVLSRCQRFDFAGIQTESIERRLAQIVESEGLEAESEALSILARRAGGSMRDSQSLLEQLLASCDEKLTAAHVHSLLGTADDSRLIELATHVVNRDPAAALAVLDGAIIAAIDVGQFLEQLLGLFRDMMAAKVGCGDDQLLSFTGSEARKIVRDLSGAVSLEATLAMLQILDSTLARFRVTTQRRTLAEIAIVRLCNMGDLDELSALISQVGSGSEVRLPAAAPSKAPVAQTAPAVASQASSAESSSLSAQFADTQSTPKPKPPQNQPEGPKASLPATESSRETTVAEEVEPAPGDVSTAVMENPNIVSLTEENCRRLWRETTEALGGLLADAAVEGRAATPAPNRLAVTFSRAYNKTICEQAENLAKIKAALARFVAPGVQIEFEVHEAPVAKVAAEEPLERVSQHQKIFEVSDHPLVKKAEELFGAKVQKVD